MRKRANQESEIGVHKYEGFTMMQNHHLRNKGLSLKAVGLLSKILSLPPDWDYSLRGLATLNTDGIDGVRSAMKELEDHGYVVRTQRRDENGRMSKSRYEVYEIPQQRKPTTENPTQINTNQVITQETNYSGNNYQSINLDGMDRMDLRARYEEISRDNLELDILSQERRFDIARVNEMVEIMLDVVCSTRPTICINGEDMPQQVVKSRFLKLNSSHIEYVLHAMNECPSDIRNIRAYMLTTLYNASLTMDNYYSALVNHDLYGQK